MKSARWKLHFPLRKRGRVLGSACVLGLAVCAGCSDARAPGSGTASRASLASGPEALESIGFEWGRDVQLQESADVINVSPQVRSDVQGRFLVADPSETQVRVYNGTGRLLSNFGAKGNGPKEFRNPMVAVRTPAGAILTADFSGKILLVDSAGAVLRTYTSPVVPLFDLDVVNDSLVLIAGRTSNTERTQLLHLWNINRNKLVRSFFPQPQLPEQMKGAALVTSHVSTAVRGDTVAAIFASSDTLYLFGLDGARRGQVPIPFRAFRPLQQQAQGGAARESLLAWTENFSLIANVFWVSDGSLLVQYMDKVQNEAKWSLLRMTRDGRAVGEISDMPQLLVSAPGDSTFYFVKPGSETPNVWSIAAFRP